MQTVWNQELNRCLAHVICSLLAIVMWATPLSAAPQIEEAPKTTRAEVVTRAREKAKAAKLAYQTVLRLSKKGASSQTSLRRTRYRKRIADLELSSLLDPSRHDENSLAAARLGLDYTTKEFEVIRNLYKRGAASKIDYLRAISARDIAKSALRSLEETEQAKIHRFDIAKTRYSLAKKELDTIEPLYKNGAISKATFDYVKSRLIVAETELAARKKELGARAIIVEKK